MVSQLCDIFIIVLTCSCFGGNCNLEFGVWNLESDKRKRSSHRWLKVPCLFTFEPRKGAITYICVRKKISFLFYITEYLINRGILATGSILSIISSLAREIENNKYGPWYEWKGMKGQMKFPDESFERQYLIWTNHYSMNEWNRAADDSLLSFKSMADYILRRPSLLPVLQKISRPTSRLCIKLVYTTSG